MKWLALIALLVFAFAYLEAQDIPLPVQEWQLIQSGAAFALTEASVATWDYDNKLFAVFGGKNNTVNNETWIYLNETYVEVVPTNDTFGYPNLVILVQIYRDPTSGNGTMGYAQAVIDRLAYSGASANQIVDSDGTNKILVLGGSRQINGDYGFYNYSRNFSLVYSPNPGYSLSLKADSPEARTLHTTLVFNDTVVMFGGRYVQNTTVLDSNTTLIYNITSDTWGDDPETVYGDSIQTRFGHSALKLNDTHMIVHGGCTFFGAITFADTYIFEVATRTWTLLNTSVLPIAKDDAAYANMTLDGFDNGTHITPTFSGRHGHNAQILYDRLQETELMFVFGGKFSNGSIVNELWALNLTNLTWRISPSPNPPSARAYTGSAKIDNQTLLVWGGVDGSDLVQQDVWVYIYNDQFNAPVPPTDPLVDPNSNYGVAGAAAGILVVLIVIVVIVKCSEKKI